MLQRLRESLALVLIALLPFHAFFITVKTRWLLGPGHAPMPQLALWKEAVLGFVLLLAIIELLRNEKWKIENEKLRRFDLIDGLIAGLFVLSVIVSIFNYQFSIINFIYGVRYDFIPLIAFFILRRVHWSDIFLKRVMNVILWSGAIIAVYGIISFFLPASFFTWLGYSDLHSLYLPDGPLAPYQQIGGTSIRRIQSVMSGPNQLGLWLLIPLAASLQPLASSVRSDGRWPVARGFFWLILCTALLLTFSRAAWIGAAVIIGIALWPVLTSMSRKAVIGLLTSAVCFLVLVLVLFPSVILRAASSRGHIENPLKAIQMMVDHPFGLGLGTAGPASNRTSDACVMLEAGSDASWAADRPDLCVFVNSAQVQPLDRACNCPFLPENWYLQIGVEMGWIGFGLYLALVIVVLLKLRELKMNKEKFSKLSIINYQLSIFASLGLAALFLHAWEDSATAYTVWMLLACILQPKVRSRH